MSFISSVSRRHGPAFIVFSLAAGLLLAAASSASAATFNGSGALTTDYVWRGTTQTQGDPAVQAGFRAAAENGLYGSIWGSNVEFAPETKASSELDFTVGWSGNLAEDWALDVNLTHYRYPSATVDLNWTEAIGTLAWKQNYWAQLGYSNDALATEEAGAYAQVGAKLPLSEQVRLEAAAGYYWLDDAYDDSYAHAQLGAVWAFKAPFELRVTAHATDSSAKTLFPDLAGSRVEAALQVSF
ncbi:TorF family putative porin [Pseudoxanthomonas japonensis]|uniref:TorF family putative porin n=1 Tax=Pseudoxanthomonas japonensis TaxID=69284 RepID=UPI001BD0F4A6|nr:TorF family putative porin [Pseudoxanthomonas japonensis]MCR6626313.1 TorF family putative porin [Pseudoxanthomonas sp.]